jgi:putative membrane protein
LRQSSPSSRCFFSVSGLIGIPPPQEIDMTTRHVYQVLGSALLLSLAGTAMAQSVPAADAKSPVNAADTTFMRNAAADGMAEVQMGQMALQQSSDAQVKQLAQRIVDDHTKAGAQLKALADSKQVTLPTVPGADAQKEGKSLQMKKSSAFDQAWSKAMVNDHQKAVKMFTQEGKQAKDADVRQFALNTLPTLNAHLQMAQKLAAVPDARDKAMDQATKSMATNPMDDAPPVIPPATTPPANAPSTPAIKH